MEGWIKLHRKLLKSDVFENEKLLKIFIWCLIKASRTEHVQLVGATAVNLLPGQFVTGKKKAAIELGMKESTVYNYLKRLEKMKIINLKSNKAFTIVTIDNYSVYQGELENSNHKITKKEPQNNTNKNVKKEKNNNIYAQEVEQLWSLYPNKKGKAQAIVKLPKLIEEYGYKVIENCVLAYARECTGKDTKYIKHGSTFFNGGYLDYLDLNTSANESNKIATGPYIDEETGEIIGG